ncbi:MAG TPA: ABC transporter ATP-binding protein [Clostridiales bacterium]|nr:ABC transporter ATP-binding protein [Clostridia bacterium]HCS75014.1 ABC transporter ATP-binding protein [Clostridiales bacterium]
MSNDKNINASEDISIAGTIKMLLGFVWKLDKVYYPILALLSISNAANTVLNIFIPKILIDGFSKDWNLTTFISVILTIAAAKFLLLQLKAFAKRQDDIHRAMLQAKFPMEFAKKVMAIDYANLEDAKVLDLKERALFPLTNFGALLQMLSSAVGFFTSLFTLVSVAAILANFSLVFTIVIAVLTLVALILSARFMNVLKEVTETIIPINRRYGYYTQIATEPRFQKEYRIYGMHTLMMKKINSYTEEIAVWLNNIYTTQGNTETTQALLTGITRFLTYSYVALRVLSDQFGTRIGLGDFSIIIGATESFANSFRGVVMDVVTLGQTISYLKPFCQFMSIPDTLMESGAKEIEALETLSFNNVSFSYPNTDKIILDKISFEINKGDKISIVGLNNAGKSTIVKLICRLFEPDSGRILWNGIDIREYDYKAYIDEISCVFQDFQLFPFTIRENIDTEHAMLNAEEGDYENVWKVLDDVGIKKEVEALPRKLDTYLDKSLYEDATDMSGGQKQKLAIARTIYKKADLVILDEPTAALDPLAESEVYENFNELTQKKTSIFISHRMSSSIFCDKILLLQDGKIVAFDSHKNLMNGDNLYRELFEAQASNYRG